jgi:hypothetical protein
MSKLRILAAEAAVAVTIWVGFLAWYHATWGWYSVSLNLAVDLGSALTLALSLVAMWASGRQAYADQQKRNRKWISLIIVLFGLLVFTAGLLAAAQQRADPCLDPRIAPGCSQTAGSGSLERAAVDTAIAYVGIAVSIISFSALVSIRLNRGAG